jgi:hypothetical protein
MCESPLGLLAFVLHVQLGGIHAGLVHPLDEDLGEPLTTPTPTLEVESCMKSSTNTNP